jgi:TonB family protein
MLPQSHTRKPRNSSKVNLVISLVFHGFLVFVALYFAARGGLLGNELKTMTAHTEKEKVEPPKIDEPKLTVTPKMTESPASPAPSTAAPEVMAPPPVDVPAFTMDGGQNVGDGDPTAVYKGLIESCVRSKWERPSNLADKDKDFVADVEVKVDSSGHIGGAKLTKSSGNRAWDDSVTKAIAQAGDIGARPPKGFPSQVTVRFDVAEEQETAFQ